MNMKQRSWDLQVFILIAARLRNWDMVSSELIFYIKPNCFSQSISQATSQKKALYKWAVSLKPVIAPSYK